MMANKYYWIQERDNPQLGTYYIARGNITTKQAKQAEKALYGSNHMHKFETKEAYEAEIKRLKEIGERIKYGHSIY